MELHDGPSNTLGAHVVSGDDAEDVIAVNSLDFAYPGCPPLISDFTVRLPRCRLLPLNVASSSGPETGTEYAESGFRPVTPRKFAGVQT